MRCGMPAAKAASVAPCPYGTVARPPEHVCFVQRSDVADPLLPAHMETKSTRVPPPFLPAFISVSMLANVEAEPEMRFTP